MLHCCCLSFTVTKQKHSCVYLAEGLLAHGTMDLTAADSSHRALMDSAVCVGTSITSYTKLLHLHDTRHTMCNPLCSWTQQCLCVALRSSLWSDTFCYIVHPHYHAIDTVIPEDVRAGGEVLCVADAQPGQGFCGQLTGEGEGGKGEEGARAGSCSRNPGGDQQEAAGLTISPPPPRLHGSLV